MSAPGGETCAGARDRCPPGSESEYHLAFLRLEYGIPDPQARHRDHDGEKPRAELRPASVVEDVVEQLDEVIGRIDPEPPLGRRRELVSGIEDRRGEVPGLEE